MLAPRCATAWGAHGSEPHPREPVAFRTQTYRVCDIGTRPSSSPLIFGRGLSYGETDPVRDGEQANNTFRWVTHLLVVQGGLVVHEICVLSQRCREERGGFVAASLWCVCVWLPSVGLSLDFAQEPRSFCVPRTIPCVRVLRSRGGVA